MDEEVISTLRGMAWERAKGELTSMLLTYYPKWDGNNKLQSPYDDLKKAIDNFVRLVENEIGLE